MLTSAIQGWIVSGLMAVGLVLMAFGWNGTHNTLIRERAEHAQVVQAFKDAQAEANKKAEAKRIELEKKAKEDAEAADKRYGTLLTEYRTNLLRYKATHSSSGGPNRSEVKATESSTGPSPSPELSTIIITVKDAEICAVNTARLISVRDWALTQQQ